MDIIEDADKMEELQTSGHGGFNKKMILACGIRGIVNKVGDGSVYVECVNGDKYVLIDTLYSNISSEFCFFKVVIVLKFF